MYRPSPTSNSCRTASGGTPSSVCALTASAQHLCMLWDTAQVLDMYMQAGQRVQKSAWGHKYRKERKAYVTASCCCKQRATLYMQ